MVDAEAKRKAAEIAEKYATVLRPMGDRDLVDELERQALMASFGYQSPSTVAMLKTAKGEILRRLKDGGGPQNLEVEGESVAPAEEPKPQRASLFD